MKPIFLAMLTSLILSQTTFAQSNDEVSRQTIDSLYEEIAKLKAEVTLLNEKIEALQPQALQSNPSLENIEENIDAFLENNANMTALALKLPIGTTKENVLKLLGNPEADNQNLKVSELGGFPGDRFKYGNVWLCFSNGILLYAVSVEKYSPYAQIEKYEELKVENLLKKK